MSDLTLLYYTANVIPDHIAEAVRDYVLKVTKKKYPIVSVSQKPIKFGKNICVGEIGASKYNLYKQILSGLKEVKTKYVACVEDDTLYSPDHFEMRPPDDTFTMNNNYWFVQIGKDYYWRILGSHEGGGMWGFMSNTKLLLDNLTKRYEAYPTEHSLSLGEPGLTDYRFGVKSKLKRVKSKTPCVVFAHGDAMGGVQLARFHRRYGHPSRENTTVYLKQFGTVKDVLKKYWKGVVKKTWLQK